MAAHAVPVHLPSLLYDQLRRRAEDAHRSVEAELLDVVATVVPMTEELPAEIEAALYGLETLDDDALWQAARTTLPEEVSERLEELHFEERRREPTQAESGELSALLRQYERTLLVRARAARLLKERGHDVDSLIRE